MKSIQNYTQYREFLADFFQLKKLDRPNFTWAEFSKNCGFSSGNHLWQVVQGKKPLTLKSIHDIAFFLGLSSRDHDYFEALVLLNQAKSKQVASVYSRRLSELSMNQGPRMVSTIMERLSGQALTCDPLAPIALLIVQNQKEERAAEILGETLGVELSKAQFLIEKLRLKGLLEGKEGTYVPNWTVLSHKLPRLSAKSREFQNAQIRLLQAGLTHHFESGSLFGQVCFGIPLEELVGVRSQLKSFLEDLAAKHPWRPDLSLFQLSVGLFPITPEVVQGFLQEPK